MEKKCIMALDAGTSSTRTIIFDSYSNIIATSQKEFRQYFPNPGWVEHDAEEIYTSIVSSMKEALKQSKLKASDISAIGITNQRETTVLWDKKTGKPVYNAIVWQSRQSVDISDSLKKKGLENEIKQKTGLPIDSYFSATKIAWILNNVEETKNLIKSNRLLFGTIDSWLIWKLTQNHVHLTDYSNASRTMLYNIHELKWDRHLLNYLDIPESILPEVKPSSYIYGYLNPDILKEPIPISGILGDQQASLFGQRCFEKGESKNTYGTGCFLLVNAGDKAPKSIPNLITTIAWGLDDKVEYAIEGSIFVAGSAIKWLKESLGIIESYQETEPLASLVEDNGGVYFVPAFTGLAAPYWDENARGMIIGLTRGSNRSHIVRATLESIAYQTKDVLDTIRKESGIEIKVLKVDGGVSVNNLLMQFQSDVLSLPVEKDRVTEITALGVAYMAGLTVGVWKDKKEILETFDKNNIKTSYYPKMDSNKVDSLYKGWKKAVKHSLNWLKE